MPPESQAQQRWAAGCLHNPRHMRGQCPAPKVAREFASGPTKGLPQRVKSKGKK
jgi:hypothetical protein